MSNFTWFWDYSKDLRKSQEPLLQGVATKVDINYHYKFTDFGDLLLGLEIYAGHNPRLGG